MSLIDRLDHTDPDTSRHIGAHPWSSALHLFARGKRARQWVVDTFALTAADAVQLDQLITHYQALDAADKPMFRSDLESALILLESGYIARSDFATLLDLT